MYPPSVLSLTEVIAKTGYDLKDLLTRASAVVLVGSRSAGCHRPDSDWDVVVFGIPGPWRVRKPGVDLIFENPSGPTDPTWLRRELCIHMSKYALWLTGAQFWKDEDLDWDGAAAFKHKRITNRAHAMLRMGFSQERITSELLDEARRLACLKRKIHVPPTAILPREYDSALRGDILALTESLTPGEKAASSRPVIEADQPSHEPK